ncbi:hypothetical protein CYMTET_36970 [Cymbomonas tetramitiformis]|uniref:Integrase catalytic domain-containing protein n=1 Tax=Cymbomonas tetramitiformis TaxID=36881 RepID=A0AAE0CG71_9CHLO|nr:hypothetical protein CYMTET_36970 [Cymbomonas tetramitiformis]
MVHVVPMHFGDSSAQTVARIYFDVVWRQHGAPMKIVCDRDPRFQDSFWRELMRLMGVRVASTTPCNPRSDDQAEASNRVVEDMLRSFVGANTDDWDLYATNVEFAINDSRSEATGFTPFELCYGVSPMSQLDLFLEAATEPGAQRRKGGGGDSARDGSQNFVAVAGRSGQARVSAAKAAGSVRSAAFPRIPTGVPDSFARRSVIPIPEPVMVDGQAEVYVDKILAYREVAERRRRLRNAVVDTAAAAEVTLAQLIQHPCDEPEPAVSEEACLPWESLCTLDDGEVARVTEADWGDERPVRILVMFSGTGSVEKQFDKCFPHSHAVTVDHDPLWRATHVTTIEDWDYRQYPPGYFDVIWASPPCTQYSQARTTGGPPDLQSADECVQRTLDIIEYFKPEHWFLENPEGCFPNALRLRPIMDKLPEPLFCTYCKYVKSMEDKR